MTTARKIAVTSKSPEKPACSPAAESDSAADYENSLSVDCMQMLMRAASD
jgi:hypothetical protein